MVDKSSGRVAERDPITKVVIRCIHCAGDSPGRRTAFLDVWRSGAKAETFELTDAPRDGERTGGVFGEYQPKSVQAYSFLIWLASRTSDAEPVTAKDVQGLRSWKPFQHARSFPQTLERLLDGSQVLKREAAGRVVLCVPVEFEPSGEKRAILDWAGVSPAARAAPTRDLSAVRRDLHKLLGESSAVRTELAKYFEVGAPPGDLSSSREPSAPLDPQQDPLVLALLDPTSKALDLVERIRWAVEAREMTAADCETLREIARLVLPQSGDVQERLSEWKAQLAGKVLVLPYCTHAEAEMALAAVAERPYRERLCGSDLASEALFPVSDIRGGATKAVLASRPLIEEIAFYFATKVLFGPRRLEQGKPIYSDTAHPELNFKNDGALERVLLRVDAKLRFHANAKDDDLLPMHIEVDVAGLFERLRDANDGLLRDLGVAFPKLSFVRLDASSNPSDYLVDCLLKIFLPIRKGST